MMNSDPTNEFMYQIPIHPRDPRSDGHEDRTRTDEASGVIE
jgi:hypothetical protein